MMFAANVGLADMLRMPGKGFPEGDVVYPVWLCIHALPQDVALLWL